MSFVETHEESINNLNIKIAEFIESLNIDFSKELSIAVMIKISGQISKLIKNTKDLNSALTELPSDDKIATLLVITIETLNSEEVSKVLPEEAREKIEKFCSDTETVNEIIELVDWVSDEIVESMDLNNDGIVTQDEIEISVNNCCLCVDSFGQGSDGCSCYREGHCCGCCQGASSAFSKCFSKFLLKCICCKKQISIS